MSSNVALLLYWMLKVLQAEQYTNPQTISINDCQACCISSRGVQHAALLMHLPRQHAALTAQHVPIEVIQIDQRVFAGRALCICSCLSCSGTATSLLNLIHMLLLQHGSERCKGNRRRVPVMQITTIMLLTCKAGVLFPGKLCAPRCAGYH